MAAFQFSALSDGDTIFSSPTNDVLNFDQASIAAGDLRRGALSSAEVMVSVVSGPQAGKEVRLGGVFLDEFSISDADGSGAGGGQLVATLLGTPPLTATDITII